jgi:hypothetical protein
MTYVNTAAFYTRSMARGAADQPLLLDGLADDILDMEIPAAGGTRQIIVRNGLGSLGFGISSLRHAVSKVTKSVSKVAKVVKPVANVLAPVAKAALAVPKGLQKVATASMKAVSDTGKVIGNTPGAIVSFGKGAGAMVGLVKPPTTPGASIAYTDANGNPITAAQYEMQMKQLNPTTSTPTTSTPTTSTPTTSTPTTSTPTTSTPTTSTPATSTTSTATSAGTPVLAGTYRGINLYFNAMTQQWTSDQQQLAGQTFQNQNALQTAIDQLFVGQQPSTMQSSTPFSSTPYTPSQGDVGAGSGYGGGGGGGDITSSGDDPYGMQNSSGDTSMWEGGGSSTPEDYGSEDVGVEDGSYSDVESSGDDTEDLTPEESEDYPTEGMGDMFSSLRDKTRGVAAMAAPVVGMVAGSVISPGVGTAAGGAAGGLVGQMLTKQDSASPIPSAKAKAHPVADATSQMPGQADVGSKISKPVLIGGGVAALVITGLIVYLIASKGRSSPQYTPAPAAPAKTNLRRQRR